MRRHHPSLSRQTDHHHHDRRSSRLTFSASSAASPASRTLPSTRPRPLAPPPLLGDKGETTTPEYDMSPSRGENKVQKSPRRPRPALPSSLPIDKPPVINPSIMEYHVVRSRRDAIPRHARFAPNHYVPVPPVTAAHAAPSLDIRPLPARCETSRGRAPQGLNQTPTAGQGEGDLTSPTSLHPVMPSVSRQEGAALMAAHPQSMEREFQRRPSQPAAAVDFLKKQIWTSAAVTEPMCSQRERASCIMSCSASWHPSRVRHSPGLTPRAATAQQENPRISAPSHLGAL